MRSCGNARIALALFALAALVILAARPILRGYEAALTALDIAGLSQPWLPDPRPAPIRTTVEFSSNHHRYYADLYRPDSPPLAGIVLQHGAAPLGKDDPRLVNLANTLARARFTVMVPDLPALRRLQIRAQDAVPLAAAFSYLASRNDLAPEGRAGIGAFSIAVGLAVLAATEPRLADQVRFVLGVGGYFDLPRTLTYFTTGYYRSEGRQRYRRPNTYGKWLFVLSNAPLLSKPADAANLARMARRRLRDAGADIGDLARALGPEGRAVYAYILNDDPERAPALLNALPLRIKSEVEALDLANKDLSRLRARLLLVHGLDDDVIPYTESLALAGAVVHPPARLFLIEGFGHIAEAPALTDAWRMWRACYALLSERG